MNLTVDHVAFGGRDLDTLRRLADAVGLASEYGGRHGDGTTHMAVVGLPDGSYLELIAPTPGTDRGDAGFWPAHLWGDAGPAGWCAEVPSVADAATDAIDAGVRVDGPHEASRLRPDGTLVEWDMCFEGPDGDERLPFVIADRTPRSFRTTPHAELADAPLTGVASVVLAVEDREETASLLARRHRLPTPVDAAGPFADFALCPGAPVALTEVDDGPLADRVDRVGEGPCAVFLGTTDLDAATDRFSLTEPSPYGVGVGDRRVAWFDADAFRGRLGVVSL
jgi:hypothetical protein